AAVGLGAQRLHLTTATKRPRSGAVPSQRSIPKGRFRRSQPFHKLFHNWGRASVAMIRDDISTTRIIVFSISVTPPDQLMNRAQPFWCECDCQARPSLVRLAMEEGDEPR